MTQQSKNDTKSLHKSGDKFADTTLKDKIGGSLKEIYDEIVNEPVPDDFLQLLAKADDSED